MLKTQLTYVRTAEGEGEDVTLNCQTEAQFNKAVTDANEYNEKNPDAKEPAVAPESQLAQTFGFYDVESDEDFALLVPEEKERVNIINRALTLKQQAAVRRFVTDPDFQAVEGVYDLADVCAKPTERKKADPMSKVKGLIKELSGDQIAAILAELQAAATATS